MVFDFLGVKEQHHYLSHFFRNFSRENIDGLLKISLWHMEKFDYLLNRLKSYKDQNGSLLDHSIVLFGSGMGHSDNHTAQRIPTVLAGKGGGRLKTGRYLRYSENQDLSRLHLALMQQFGVDEYRERPFESWTRLAGNKLTVQGRLRMSENLDEAVEIEFRDFHDFNFPYHVGTPIRLTGSVAHKEGRPVLTKITELKSVFGNSSPRTRRG
jgi:hypothetical protein